MLIGCLKAISGFGAFVILLVGLGMTGITIYGFYNSEIFLDDTKQRSTILGILITADLIIVLGSILGIYGLKKSNAFLICVFQILVIVFLVIFFALGIAANVIPSKFFDGDCQNSNNPTLALAFNVTTKANNTLCTACQCNLKSSTISQYNIVEQAYLSTVLINRNDTAGVVAWQNCAPIPIILPMTQEEKDMGTALGAIENLFGCAGWCNNQPKMNLLYHFSDINKVRPNGYCYDKVYDAVHTYSSVVGAGALITAGFLLLISAINLCICCHPTRRKLSYKDRFVYMKDGEYSKI